MALMASNIPGKGRAVVAARPLAAGEVILTESPLLLLVDEDCKRTVCATCLQVLQSSAGPLSCNCQQVFCCSACQSSAQQQPHLHSQQVCQALQRLTTRGLSPEAATALRFLVHMKAAKAAVPHSSVAKAAWDAVMGLSEGKQAHDSAAADLYARLSAATGDSTSLSKAEVDLLLRKEACNSYGIMAPSGAQGLRQTRGSGIYPSASLLNHDCLPNTARFDRFDVPAAPGQPGDTTITVRALHDIPAGEELTASYFPLHCTYAVRQERCREVYGFECSCLRCKEESTWSDDEDADDDMEGDDMDEEKISRDAAASQEGVAASSQEANTEEGVNQGVDASYIQLFLLKYVCPQPDCFGTMAPILSTDRYECNMCGFVRTEGEFLAEIQAWNDG